MAKVKFAPDVESISGKLCSRSGVIYAVNKQTGITHRLERHEFTDTNTEAQQAVRKAFLSKGKFASAWWKANKPSAEKPKGSEHYLLVMKAYKGQHKIGNPYSYLCSLVTDDLKVKLGDLDITGSVTPDAGAGTKPGTSGSGTQGSGTTEGGGEHTGEGGGDA